MSYHRQTNFFTSSPEASHERTCRSDEEGRARRDHAPHSPDACFGCRHAVDTGTEWLAVDGVDEARTHGIGAYAEQETSRVLGGGTIPQIGIQDAKSNHGRRIRDTVIRLGPFLTEYFRKRTDVKPSIKINWSHTRRNLLAFFGPDKPLAAVTVGDARDFERYLKGDARQNRYADKEASDGLS